MASGSRVRVLPWTQQLVGGLVARPCLMVCTKFCPGKMAIEHPSAHFNTQLWLLALVNYELNVYTFGIVLLLLPLLLLLLGLLSLELVTFLPLLSTLFWLSSTWSCSSIAVPSAVCQPRNLLRLGSAGIPTSQPTKHGLVITWRIC